MLHSGMKLGPFLIEKELGAGAMGAVYGALHEEKKRRVAIKVMAPGIASNATLQARFQREAEILKQLNHPNIVRLWAVGQYKKAPFYAMEFIQGESLDRVLARRGKLPWEEVVALGRQLCAALQHAHDHGIIHRDLKPSNLMLLPDGTLKLTDFGIAKDMDVTGLTATNCTVGTAAYMSPEQCRGKGVTAKSDLYSMGVVLYELLTGRKPFYADSILEMFTLHTTGTFERPSRFVMDIPVWLDNLVCQLLEKDPENRPYSAAAVGDALAQIEEKVATLQSAGMEAVSARAGARPGKPIDEMDREAARTLLGKKKKKKKRKLPIYRRAWFQAVVLGALLLAAAAFLYYVLFTPPSLESLYQQTADLMGEKDFDSWRAAQTGPLALFRAHYKDAKGDLADALRRWSDEADRKVYDYWLYSRRAAGLPADDKGETAARQALDSEEGGDLREAVAAWQKLAAQKNDADQEKRGWGLVGELHQGQIAAALKELHDLDYLIRDDRVGAYKGRSPEEQLAVQALRAEIWEHKPQTAAKLWEDLKQRTRDQDALRTWRLMAAQKLRELSQSQK